MRLVGVVLALAMFASGCRSKGDADAAPDPAALKAQQELLARRDKLLEQRQHLEEKRSGLDLEIKEIEKQGGDASEKKKEKADIDSQLDNSTANELQQLNTKLDTMKQSGDRSAQMASREAEVANREAAVATRERALADREKGLIQRDSEMAARWKDTCQASSAPVIIQAPAKGGNYSKKDVSDLIARARAGMSKKGLLVADLPGPAQSLESEASKALNDNDTSKAYFVASQLVGMVDSIQINRPFIQAKMARVQAQIKSSKQDEATTQQLSGILSQVIQNFGDGDFNAANKRLNQLVAMLK
ncbi:MAG TPA: hypothetical protein VFQ65_10435 [Kofleriaceae bacterium]|nr:hypothetical protein [Kofleriaceae bacterium]